MGPGTPLPCREDPPFLTVASRFPAAGLPENAAHAVVVRSPHAHAIVRRIDTAAARGAPGALLVLTAADVAGEIPRPIPSFSSTPPFDIRGTDGRPAPDAEQYPLARDRVRYAGEAVALVVG